MTVDKRFALLTDDGQRLYPYKKSQRSTNRHGFALTVPGEADRHGGGYYTDSIEEVIKRLVFDGWSVRAKTVGAAGNQRHGTYGIGKRTIIGYEIDEDLIRLVDHAPTKPRATTRTSSSIRGSLGNKESSESPVDELSFRAIKTRRGQTRFRGALIAELPQCRVTGSEAFSVLEAAHIIPHSDESNYSLSNGLLLRADIHTLYDLNLIGIDVDGAIHVASSLDGTEYAAYRGKTLVGPRSPERAKNLEERFRRWYAPAKG